MASKFFLLGSLMALTSKAAPFSIRKSLIRDFWRSICSLSFGFRICFCGPCRLVLPIDFFIPEARMLPPPRLNLPNPASDLQVIDLESKCIIFYENTYGRSDGLETMLKRDCRPVILFLLAIGVLKLLLNRSSIFN